MRLYNELSKYADLTYETKDYRKEARFIIDIFRKYKVKPKLIYDVACGSGRHSQLLMSRGYKVVGVDLNKGMINLAKKRVPALKIYRQDMRKLNMKEKADCIITMFNAINHFSSYEDFESMLKSYKRNLNKGGLVIFDTMFDQRNWLDEYHNARTIKKGNVTVGKVDRSFKMSRNKGFVHQVFVVFEDKKKTAKIFESKYENFVYDLGRMKKIIREVGFKYELYYNFSLTEKRTKNCYYVFVLQK